MTPTTLFRRLWLLACAAFVADRFIFLQRVGIRLCRHLTDEYMFVPGLEPAAGGLLGPAGYVDSTLGQEDAIQAHLLPLCATAAAFVACSQLLARAAPRLRPAFYVASGVAWLALLQRSAQNVAATLSVLISGYVIGQAAAGTRHGLLLVWVWHSALLLQLCSHAASANTVRGQVPWHGSAYGVMRMISFAADLHWSRTQRKSRRLERRGVAPNQPPAADHDYQTRAELSLAPHSYSLINYLAYNLYAPLFVVGPICSFNAFASQLTVRPSCITAGRVALYAARLAAAWLAHEWFRRMFCFQAVGGRNLWPLLQQSLGRPLLSVEVAAATVWWFASYGFACTFQWRFARFWTMADGVDVPEDMLQCPVTFYHGLRDYWRNWHASFNVWCVRYVFVPVASNLGSSNSRLASLAGVWSTFAFSGVWHALHTVRGLVFQLNYVFWGLLVAGYITVEQQVINFGRGVRHQGWVFEQCAAAAGAVSSVVIVAVGDVFLGGSVRPQHGTAWLVGWAVFTRFGAGVLLYAFCAANVVQACRRLNVGSPSHAAKS